MGFLDSITDVLFGKAPSVETQAPTSKYSPEQQDLLRKLALYYQGFAGDTTYPAYSGTRVAPLGSMFESAKESLAGYTPFLQNIAPSATTALNDIISGGISSPDYMRKAYELGIENPMLKNWKEKIIPELSGQFAKKGLLYGSGRETAERESTDILTRALATGRANLEAELSRAGEANRLTGISTATGFGNQSLAEIMGLTQTKTGVEATERGVEQSKMDIDYQNWLKSQPGARPQDIALMAILGLNPYYDQQTVVSGGSTGLLDSLTKVFGMYAGGKAGSGQW